jgi:hypothetical protein
MGSHARGRDDEAPRIDSRTQRQPCRCNSDGYCRGHDHRNPTSAIRENHGNILFHCHAGCKQREVGVTATQTLGTKAAG